MYRIFKSELHKVFELYKALLQMSLCTHILRRLHYKVPVDCRSMYLYIFIHAYEHIKPIYTEILDVTIADCTVFIHFYSASHCTNLSETLPTPAIG